MSDCHGCAGCAVAEAPSPSSRSARTHVVAIIGPPNSGKSTLFNRLTGLRQKVANFPGVTVEQRVGKAKMHGKTAPGKTGTQHTEVVLIDLPGVYSLNPRSEDEQVTRDVLAGAMPGIPKPDAVLLILDCTNLGRHLVLAAPILSLKLPTLVILNMADDLKSRGGHVDTAELANQLGSPVALISAS
ncbi:MAG: 50S ribosome-binding GTPase, partial [Bryobacterales bacterium]|nr:50S ribosome-binding GTPase [Bryobacterales bacterium]